MAREVEARAVQQFLARTDAGPAGLVVEGEPGIGKTTVWSDAVQRAVDAGFTVLSTRGAAAEARLTYTAVADLLEDVDPAILGDLTPLQQVALDRVLLRGDGGPATDERAVAAAFSAVVERLLHEAPVLVAVDDVQWLDSSSQVVLGFAARRLRGRVGVLVTARTGDPDAVDIGSWLHMPRPDAVIRICLRPMSLASLHAVLVARLGRTLPRPVITRIHAISGGNPFYALELARAFDVDSPNQSARLPASLVEVVRSRVGAVDDDTVALLLAVACAARPTVEVLSRVSDAAPARVLERLATAEEQGIIRLDGSRVGFTHPLLAHGVYTAASPTARRSVHARLAEIVDQPEVRARHLALAATSNDSATLEALDAAVDSAAARGAPSAAAELVDMAINLGGDTPSRRLRAAEQHFRAGSLEVARTHLNSVIDTAPSGTLRAVALMLLAAIAGHGESLVQAVEALTEAVDEARNRPLLRVQALLLLAPAVGLIGRLDASVGHARTAVAEAERLGVPTMLSQALAMRCQVTFMYGLGTDEQSLQTAIDLEEPGSATAITFSARAVRAVNSAWRGNLRDSRAQMDAVGRYCADYGSEMDVLWAGQFSVSIDVWLGRYGDAAVTARDMTQRGEQVGGAFAGIWAMTGEALVAAYTGRVDDARAAACSALDAARACGGVFLEVAPLTTLGFLDVSVRDYAAALTTLAPLLASFDAEHGTEIMVGAYLPDAIEALVGLGRLEEAEPLTAALETNGARLDRPWMLAMGARCRAMMLTGQGDLDSAAHHADLAMRHHDRLPMPFERARTQLLVGQLQRRRRRRQAAASSVTEALAAFEELESPLWAHRARAELERLTAPSVEGFGLTASEQRVAERAAAGLSNREIATELFVAVKTVERNLSATYHKLGIRSRAQLPTRLSQQSLQGNP